MIESQKAASEAWEAYDRAALECHRMRLKGVPADERLPKEIEAVRLHREFARALEGQGAAE